MIPGMAKKLKVTIAIDGKLVHRVDRLAKARGISRSAMLCELVADVIGEEELFVKAANQPLLMQSLMRAFAQPGVLRQMAQVMGQDMSDEQLELFQRATSQLASSMAPEVQPAKGKSKQR